MAQDDRIPIDMFRITGCYHGERQVPIDSEGSIQDLAGVCPGIIDVGIDEIKTVHERTLAHFPFLGEVTREVCYQLLRRGGVR